MALALRVRDEVYGAEEKPTEWTLDVLTARMKVRDLIRRRIEEEVRLYNLKPQEIFRGLVQPTDAEVTLNGAKRRTRKPIDAAAQVKRALDAFTSNGFFLLVNDRQVSSLDEEISLGVDTRLSFVKLLPLVGG